MDRMTDKEQRILTGNNGGRTAMRWTEAPKDFGFNADEDAMVC